MSLAAFAGTWMLDVVSVSRAKVAKKVLGDDGFRKLRACRSIEELRACAQADGDLAARYATLLNLGGNVRLEIAPHSIVWHREENARRGASSSTPYRIQGVSTEGRSTIVTATPSSLVLRMKDQWLLASARYTGARAGIFPRSPTFRFYRAAPHATDAARPSN